MKKPGIEELLIRCVLDPAFLRQLRQSPEDTFDDYDLSDRAKAILASPDERLLELLGEAVGNQTDAGPAGAVARNETAPAEAVRPPPPATALPLTRLAVRLVPYVQQPAAPAGEPPAIVVNYAGHLDPMPDGVELGDLPDVPGAVTDGEPLPPVSVIVGVRPAVWTDDDGNRQITFSVTAEVPNAAAAPEPPLASAARLSPWPHDIDSPDVEAAAARVREAGAGERYERLRELIDVMVVPAESPGAAQ